MGIEQDIIDARFYDLWETVFKYNEASSNAILADYKKALANIDADLAKAKEGTYNKARLKKLKASLVKRIDAGNAFLETRIATASVKATRYVIAGTEDILSWGGRVSNFNNIDISDKTLIGMVKNVKMGDRKLSGWIESATFPLQSTINQGIIRGQNSKVISRKLANDYMLIEKDIRTIARTYIAETAVAGNKAVYHSNKDIINRYEWNAALENADVKTGRGTCTRCKALDGVKWTEIKDAPSIPLHPNCRCQILPISKTWKELGIDIEEQEEIKRIWNERDIKKGPRGGYSRKVEDFGYVDKDYPEWWASKSKEWQDTSIGPVRAELVRTGEVPFRKLVVADRDYQMELNVKTATDGYSLGDLVNIVDL